MLILIHGNPCDGFGFIGPFPDRFGIDERHTAHLTDWWIASLDEPDRTITLFDLDETERYNFDELDFNEPDPIKSYDDALRREVDYALWRDMNGIAWCHDERTATTHDLTNGVVPLLPD